MELNKYLTISDKGWQKYAAYLLLINLDTSED